MRMVAVLRAAEKCVHTFRGASGVWGEYSLSLQWFLRFDPAHVS